MPWDAADQKPPAPRTDVGTSARLLPPPPVQATHGSHSRLEIDSEPPYVATLRRELSETRKESVKLCEAINDLQADKQILDVQNNNLVAANAKLRHENVNVVGSRNNTENKILTTQNKNLVNENQNLRADIAEANEARKNAEAVTEQVKEQKSEIVNLREQLREHGQLATQLAAQQEEIEKLTQEIANLKTSIAEEAASARESSASNKVNPQTRSAGKLDTHMTEPEVDDADPELPALRDQVTALITERDTVNNDYDRLRDGMTVISMDHHRQLRVLLDALKAAKRPIPASLHYYRYIDHDWPFDLSIQAWDVDASSFEEMSSCSVTYRDLRSVTHIHKRGRDTARDNKRFDRATKNAEMGVAVRVWASGNADSWKGWYNVATDEDLEDYVLSLQHIEEANRAQETGSIRCLVWKQADVQAVVEYFQAQVQR